MRELVSEISMEQKQFGQTFGIKKVTSPFKEFKKDLEIKYVKGIVDCFLETDQVFAHHLLLKMNVLLRKLVKSDF